MNKSMLTDRIGSKMVIKFIADVSSGRPNTFSKLSGK